MVSNILIYNKEIGFIRINEGTGYNLLDEDIEQGYSDYIMVYFLEYDGFDLIEKEGTQVMLEELYQNKFTSVDEVIQYLIETGFIENQEYIVLYAA